MTFNEILAAIEVATKVEDARPSTSDIMKNVGVESYNPCDGEYHHILKALLPFLMENGFTPTKGGQTFKSFMNDNTVIYIGYNMSELFSNTGIRVCPSDYKEFFIPLYNDEDAKYSSVMALLHKFV